MPYLAEWTENRKKSFWGGHWKVRIVDESFYMLPVSNTHYIAASYEELKRLIRGSGDCHRIIKARGAG